MTPATERHERTATRVPQSPLPPPFPIPLPQPADPTADPFLQQSLHSQVAALHAQVPSVTVRNPPLPLATGSAGVAQLRAAAEAIGPVAGPSRGRGRGQPRIENPVSSDIPARRPGRGRGRGHQWLAPANIPILPTNASIDDIRAAAQAIVPQSLRTSAPLPRNPPQPRLPSSISPVSPPVLPPVLPPVPPPVLPPVPSPILASVPSPVLSPVLSSVVLPPVMPPVIVPPVMPPVIVPPVIVPSVITSPVPLPVLPPIPLSVPVPVPQNYSRNQLRIGMLAARRSIRDNIPVHNCGPMSIECPHCHALHWYMERLGESTANNHLFGMCCLKGAIILPPLQPLPPPLSTWMYDPGTYAHFMENIRQYNAALAFTSVNANWDQQLNQGGGPYVLNLHGTLYHKHGPLQPREGQPPKYAQLYIFDAREALNIRMGRNINLDPVTMQALQNMMLRYNPYATQYKTSMQRLHENPERCLVIRLSLIYQDQNDCRTYNPPRGDEIAAIIPDLSAEHRPREVIIEGMSGNMKRISSLHGLYMPLHYVLLFPTGEYGWHPELYYLILPRRIVEGRSQRRQPERKNLTLVKYLAYQLHIRPEIPEISSDKIFRAGRLFMQFIVDGWAVTEEQRLDWIRRDQEAIRSDTYKGLLEAEPLMAEDGTGTLITANLGQRFILPASFTGGSRDMRQRLQDSFAIFRKVGCADVFITMTANPKWVEIQNALLRGQTAVDRPDIVDRVFEMKKNQLLYLITKKHILGKVQAYVYVIEFQKRGLPHIHLLVWLDRQSKLHTAEDVDSLVSAQLPDPQTHPNLYGLVTKHMMHGPCGSNYPNAPCMEDGKCKKFFPKPFQAVTNVNEEGYPLYARPRNGRMYNGLHNGFVVPYNWLLLQTFKCHINVELTHNVRAIKYIHKYLYKGHDRTTMQINRNIDEIKQYLEARYVSSHEAFWRIMEFDIHGISPSVVALPVHLKDEQRVVFNTNDSIAQIITEARRKLTMLTAYFELNKTDPLAAQILYINIPEHFVWKKLDESSESDYNWYRRKRGNAIGRIHWASPLSGERYYLRLLLTVVRGATSFEDLRRTEGRRLPWNTFQEACLARGLIIDDQEWENCLAEASSIQTGNALRHLFASMLLYCKPARPQELWIQFRDYICDDLEWEIQKNYPNKPHPTLEEIYDYGLFKLNQILEYSNKPLEDFPNMPQFLLEWEIHVFNRYLAEQLRYNPREQNDIVQHNRAQMNPEQIAAYDAILSSVINKEGKRFFLDGPGGTGKSFVWNTLAAAVRAKGLIVLCVASSGIASLILAGGRTCHNMFDIPLEVKDTTMSKLRKMDDKAQMLAQASLIIWDEVTMQHRDIIDCVDRSLRDFCSQPGKPFGGITVAWGGDFQQTLPVIEKGTMHDALKACIKYYPLWRGTTVLHLTRNMRVDTADPQSVQFAQWLLDIGRGRNLPPGALITIPEHMRIGPEIQDLISAIYPDFIDKPNSFFLERAILCPRNSEVDEINNLVLASFPGVVTVLNSADSVRDDSGNVEGTLPYPTDYLTSIAIPGLPPSKLEVKIGVPLMVLRNLDPGKGLCNGTRVRLLRATNRVLHVSIITGPKVGETAFIPRITLDSGKKLPFTLQRRQFPVKLAFAMTINKSQGQTLETVGVDLRYPVFSHGQLYVAFSRGKSWRRVKVLLNKDKEKTENVVYQQVFTI